LPFLRGSFSVRRITSPSSSLLAKLFYCNTHSIMSNLKSSYFIDLLLIRIAKLPASERTFITHRILTTKSSISVISSLTRSQVMTNSYLHFISKTISLLTASPVAERTVEKVKTLLSSFLEAENAQLKGQLDVAGITGVAYGACVAVGL
jgi:hypothetical protein